MDHTKHPMPELTAVLGRIVRLCLVDHGWGREALEGAVTQALRGWTSDGRRWSRLDRTVAEALGQAMQWCGLWGDRAARTTTLGQALHDVLADEVRSRALYNLPGPHQADGAAVLALLGAEGDRETLRWWLRDSPYVELLARTMWDELSAELLARRLRSFLVREPDALGFVGRLPAVSAAAPCEPDGPDGTTLHFLRERVNTADIRGSYTIHWCMCLATRQGGTPAAISAGYVLRQPRKGLSDAEFYERCDAESQELADLAHALIRLHGPVCQLFDAGPLFYLEQWEVAASERGRGLGIAVLERHLARLRGEFLGLATVALQHAPAAFPQPFDLEGPDEVCDEYARGVAALMTYWERHRPWRVLGAHARSIAFDVPRALTGDEQLRRLGQHLHEG